MIDTWHRIGRWILLAGLTLVPHGQILAERLPVRQYGIVDGLPTDAVAKVFRDTRGFLWFCTHAGLSRFDGHEFSNYGVEDGLPVDVLVDIGEDPTGVYWIALWGGGGVCRFDPRSTEPTPRFTPYRLGDGGAERSTALLVDRSGNVWVGTIDGLFVRHASASPGAPFQPVRLGLPPEGRSGWRIQHLLEDRFGFLWIATPGRLLRRSPSGEVVTRFVLPSHSGWPGFTSVLGDRQGRIWMTDPGGLTVFRPRERPALEPERGPENVAALPSCSLSSEEGSLVLPSLPGEGCRWPVDRLPGSGEPRGLFESSGGHFWIARYHEGLTEFDGERFHDHGPEDGLAGYLVVGFGEDLAGNLWLATMDSGALRIARSGFTAYDRSDGLGYTRRARLSESLQGEVAVIAGPVIYRFDGERFESLRPGVLKGLGRNSADMSAVLQDHTGEWWFGTRRGLFRFAAAESVREIVGRQPIESFTRSTGLPADGVTCLFEDSSGDLWIGFDARGRVGRWERSSRTLRVYGEEDGLPAASRAIAITEDLSGRIWIGFGRGVARFRDGRFELFTRTNGLSADGVVRPYVDRSGRLWLASGYAGVTRVDDPVAENPSFAKRHTKADGLAGDPVLCAVEDDFGRMYFCTLKGVDRLEPETGRIRHYTTADGLSTSEIVQGMRDRNGALWFTGMRGVSKLVPRAAPPAPAPPPVWINGIRVAGVPTGVPEIGETEISGLRLPFARNQVRIDFASLSFEVGEQIRYRYRLGEHAPWSEPSSLRSIQLANLSPGRYRFEVQAVNSHGVESARPAAVEFLVLPPVWRRWWVLTLAAVALGGLAAAFHRARIARAVEMERVRTRIATDLHDDIGASLSQIAILSEVLNRRKDLGVTTSRAYLSRIAESSRELVDSMADIVWAINPRRDRLNDLVRRMRRFLGDGVAGQRIEYVFDGPATESDLRLGPDLRREILLVFKEGVNNAVRHSGCERLEVRLGLDGKRLTLEVRDDGRGFDPEAEYDGTGLESMRRRAREMGGSLELESIPDRGTTLRLRVPLVGKSPVAGGFRHLNR